MSFFKELIWYLPSVFTKKENSNIGKIIKLIADNYNTFKDNLELQLKWKDISQAQGSALDEIGKMVGLPRGTYDDEKYRVRIKTRIAQNISDGTINSVIEALAATLEIDTKDIVIKVIYDIAPATIRIEKIPVESLNKAGVTQEELIKIVKSIVASGIDVESLQLVGSFRFSNNQNANEINENTGFFNEQTGKGGTFGDILDV